MRRIPGRRNGTWVVVAWLALSVLAACVRSEDGIQATGGAMQSDRPEYVVNRAARPIVVDGKLDDKAWKGANVMDLVLADSGGVPRQRTQARVLWDDDYLYI